MNIPNYDSSSIRVICRVTVVSYLVMEKGGLNNLMRADRQTGCLGAYSFQSLETLCSTDRAELGL